MKPKRKHPRPPDCLDTFDRELNQDTIHCGDIFRSQVNFMRENFAMVTWTDKWRVQIGLHFVRWEEVPGIWYAVSQDGGKTWRRIR